MKNRLTEMDITRIVRRVVNEQGETPMPTPSPPTPTPSPEETSIPDCSTKLKNTDSTGEMIVGSRTLQLPDGEMKIVYSGGRPDTRGYIITINETPFCKIPN